MKYVVDTNFFIQSHRETYPLDVAVTFWIKVKELAESGVIVSIDKVRGEIYGQGDDLEIWCVANLPDNFFKGTNTAEVMVEYGKAVAWASGMSHHYKPSALQEFLQSDEADPFLASYVSADSANRTLVTQEVSNPRRKNKIQLPECCGHLGVRYINMIEMFRELGERF